MSEWQEIELGILPCNWIVVKVEELVNSKVLAKPLDGNHGEIHPKGNDFVNSGIPFVMATDVVNGKVDLVNCKFITENQAKGLNKGFSISGDVLLTHKASIGRTAIVGKLETPYIMLTPQVTYYRVIDKEKLNNKYLKYYFDSPVFQDTLANHGDSGSTRAYIGITAQRELPICIPTILEQQAIAAVLSSLDDKIDLLHRQNKTLEAMAETLFRQWFIEEASEDWEEVPLGNFISPKRGQNLTKAQAIDGIYPVIAGGLTPSCFHNNCNTKEPVITISASGANAGYVCLHHISVWSSDSSFIDNSITEYVYFFYVLLKYNQNAITDKQEGSAQPHIYPSHVMELKVLNYPLDLIESFEKQVKPKFEKIKSNKKQIQTLEKLRDNLLPKLMSGEVRVKF